MPLKESRFEKYSDAFYSIADIMNDPEFWEPMPDIDFMHELLKCKTEFERQIIYKQYYSFFTDRIIRNGKRGKWYRAYGIDFTLFFTRIEYDAWQAIRASRIILYPQYPVLQYFLDFANPLFKIGLELDGKEFHNAEKDFKRDEILAKEGWQIYRVTGSEAVRPLRQVFDPTDEYEVAMKRCINLHNTVEGVVESLYQVFFNRNPIKDEYYYECVKCLNDHTLQNAF